MMIIDWTSSTGAGFFAGMVSGGETDDDGKPVFRWHGSAWDRWLTAAMPDPAERERLMMEFGRIALGSPDGPRLILLNGERRSGSYEFLQFVTRALARHSMEIPSNLLMWPCAEEPLTDDQYEEAVRPIRDGDRYLRLLFFNDAEIYPLLQIPLLDRLCSLRHLSVVGIARDCSPVHDDHRVVNFMFGGQRDKAVVDRDTVGSILYREGLDQEIASWMAEGAWMEFFAPSPA